jgi:hypothetical protein
MGLILEILLGTSSRVRGAHVWSEGEEVVMQRQRRDLRKERYWDKVIGEAARSGMSIREFCRGRKLKEGQLYWWQRILKHRRQERTLDRPETNGAKGRTSFALVSEAAGSMDAGIELVMSDGCRLRIGTGVDAETLRTVLTAVGSDGC